MHRVLKAKEPPPHFVNQFYRKRFGEMRAQATLLRNENQGLRRDVIRMQEMLGQYRTWFERAPVGFHFLDREGRILDVNERWLKLLGYSRNEVFGRPIFDFIVQPQRENARARFHAVINGEPLPEKIGERKYIRKDGTEIYVKTVDSLLLDVRGQVVGVQTSFEDITALKEAEALLMEQQRRAAVGEWLSSVAHTFGNSTASLSALMEMAGELEKRITEINGFIELNRNEPEIAIDHLYPALHELQASLRDYLARVRANINDLHNYSRNICGLGRNEETESTIVCLKKALENQIEELRHIVSKKTGCPVEILTNFNGIDLCDGIMISKRDIKDIIFNLVNNAIQVFPADRKTAGKILVSVSKSAEGKIQIRVSDNGPGIPAAVRERLFRSPVLSTGKEAGEEKGSGFGLLTAAKRTENAKGTIHIEAPTGEWATTFMLEFPQMDYVTAETPKTQPVGDPQPKPNKRSYTILFVEDEEVLRELIPLSLENKCGHKVIACATAEEALRVCKDTIDEIDILITDQTLPKMAGSELIVEMMRLKPGLRCIVSSAMSPNEDLKDPIWAVLKAHPDSVKFYLKSGDPMDTVLTRLGELFDSFNLPA